MTTVRLIDRENLIEAVKNGDTDIIATHCAQYFINAFSDTAANKETVWPLDILGALEKLHARDLVLESLEKTQTLLET